MTSPQPRPTALCRIFPLTPCVSGELKVGFLEERASSWALNLAWLLKETGWPGGATVAQRGQNPGSVVKGLHAQQRSACF